jgi:phosphoglycerol transferase MdoB-like AlkP superfamily enzyme
MSEVNNNTVNNEAVLNADKPTKGQKFSAGVKEWFRKLTVKLKHNTQLIPFVILIITSFVYLCLLSSLSIVVNKNRGISNAGIAVFVNTLISILVLLVFLNAFPKRKKPNIIFLVMVFVMLAALIGLDILFYSNVTEFATRAGGGDPSFYYEVATYIPPALTGVIVHIVFVGVSILALALMPLYKKLICKINTSKNIESTSIKEEIDTSEE